MASLAALCTHYSFLFVVDNNCAENKYYYYYRPTVSGSNSD